MSATTCVRRRLIRNIDFGNTPLPIQIKIMSHSLPSDWSIGPPVAPDDIHDAPPPSSDPEQVCFYGMTDAGYCLVTVPASTAVADVARFFRVGSHGAMSYGLDEDETVDVVASNLTKIEALIPCRVTFADEAGLTVSFTRQISEDEVAQLESFFEGSDPIQAGLEAYMSEWDGEGSLLASVLRDNSLHLWWD